MKKAKFKDVATVVGGSTPKTEVADYWGGDNFWVAPAELDGSKFISSTVKKITDLAVEKTNLTLLPIGTVLLSSRAPIGKVAITTVPMYCNQGFKNIICGPELFNGYVYYFLKHNVSYLQSLGTGATFKEISKKVVENVAIAYPSFDEQQRIVDELDLLTGIIDKKNAQLRDLDALAQSIFYEMFGDPITNNKGWSVRKVIEVVKLQRGYDLPIQDRDSYGSIPIYGSNGIIDRHSEYKAPLGIITGRSGTLGRVYYSEKPFWPLNTTLFSVDCHGNNVVYLKYLLSNYHLERFGAGAGVPTLNRNEFHGQPIISVPVETQLCFAERVSAIESHKALIQKSVEDAQKLFNSRMSHYFD